MSEKILRLGAIAAAVVAVGAVSVSSFLHQANPDATRTTAVVDPRPAAQLAAASHAASPSVDVTSPPAVARPAATQAIPDAPAPTARTAQPAPTIGAPAVVAASSAVRPAVSAPVAPTPPVRAAAAANPAASSAPSPSASAAAPTLGLVKNTAPAKRELPNVALAPTQTMPAVQPMTMDDGQTLAPKSGASTQRKMGVAPAPEIKQRTARTGKAKRRHARAYLPYPIRRLFSSLGH